MVNRCLTTQPPSALRLTVVDLDGTYLAANSLHLYLRTAFFFHLRHRNLRRCAGIAVPVFLRLIRAIPHHHMKFKALTSAGASEGLLSAFAEKALAKVNPEVAEIVGRCKKNGETVVIATAAPRFYVEKIFSGPIIATEFIPGDNPAGIVECRGEEKLRRVCCFIKDGSHTLVRFISDHYDDLPLFRHTAECGGDNILVGPSSKTIAMMHGTGYRILHS